ncbi:MAG: Jag N-terminal domain-containing protein [Dehalococcoidia bacterium]|nr:Jag N-terminal domain-containing protein [Dehalococcoidia bacterium]
MDQVEATGKTVEDALKKALAKLNAHPNEVEFVVLDEGRKGFLGRGGRDALIRAERIKSPAPPAEGRGEVDTRIPRSTGRGGQRGSRPPRPPGQPRPDSAPRGGQRRGDRSPRRSGSGPLEAASPRLTEADFLRPPTYEEETAASPPPRAERGRRQPRAEQPPRPPRDSEPRRRRDDLPEIAPDINAEEVDYAAHVVDDLLRLVDITAELTIREPLSAGDGLGSTLAVIDISGDDLGLLIGRRGETLLSLQYIVNLIVSRRFPGKGGVTIDVEHYRHRREEEIVSRARRMADRVRQTGNPITLEPMTPSERRLVHMAFADDPELMTNSIGEGDNRKVVISTRR